MLARVKNYDVLCYQLRNNLYSQLDFPLMEELNQLSKNIKNMIVSGQRIQTQSVSMLRQIFNLRVKAIKWLASESNFDYSQMLNEITPQIEKINEDKRLEVLIENLLFALRCNQRVVENVFKNVESPSSVDFSTTFIQLPEITYDQFLASLAFAIPDDEAVQKIIDWTNSSLHIEFTMVATDIIYKDKLKVSDKTINELAFLVADAAQEYSALATELGIIKSRTSRQSIARFSFDNSFIKEQKEWADLGLEDFVETLSK